jgi:hypothetical protein
MNWRQMIAYEAENEGAGGVGTAEVDPPAGDNPPVGATEAQQEAWYDIRIRQLTARAKSAEEKLEAAAKAPKVEGGNEAPAALTQKDVEAKAAEIAATKEFNEACDKVWNTGKEEFGDFGAKIENFKKLGGLPVPVIEAALETGVPHKVLHELGSNMDEAARILALPPLKMAVAIAKLGEKVSKAKPTSQAPDPITPTAGRSRVSADAAEPEKMSLDQWMKWRDKQVSERGR